MKFRQLAKLSTRMFKARTLRTLLTILGMGVGIGAILFLVALGYGVQKALLETITTSDSLLSLDVYPGKTEEFISAENVEMIKQIEGVNLISPVMDTNIQVKFNGVISDSVAMVVDSNFLRLNGTKVKNGIEINDNEPNGILISPTFAKLFEKEADEMLGQEISILIKSYEDEENQKNKGRAEFEKKQERQQAGDQFDQRIAPGDFGPAVSASGAQNQEADNRNVVVKTNRMSAGRTAGSRLHNGGFRRNAENADVKKAADRRAEDEGKNIKNNHK